MCHVLGGSVYFLGFSVYLAYFRPVMLPCVKCTDYLESFKGILAFVLGMPAFFAHRLYRMKTQNVLKDKNSLAVWGFLYTSYEHEFFYWEVVILARRLVLCFLMVSFYETPHFQLAVGIPITIFFIAMQYFARPFKVSELDLLDAVGVLSIAFYMVAGFVFTTANTEGQYSVTSMQQQITVVVLLISTLGTIVLGMFVLLKEIKRYHDSRYTEEVIFRYTVGFSMKASVAIGSCFASSQDLIHFMNVAADGNVTLEIMTQLTKHASLELDTFTG